MSDEKQDFWNPNRTRDYKALEKAKQLEAKKKETMTQIVIREDHRTTKYKYV